MTDPYQEQPPQEPQPQQPPPQQPPPQYYAPPQAGQGQYGPQYGQGQQYGQPMTGQARVPEKGLLARVFDLSFDHFVTPSIIKIIFVLILAFEGLYALFWLVLAFNGGAAFGLLGLIIIPVVWFLLALLTRIWMETLIVLFKIKEDLGAIRRRGGF